MLGGCTTLIARIPLLWSPTAPGDSMSGRGRPPKNAALKAAQASQPPKPGGPQPYLGPFHRWVKQVVPLNAQGTLQLAVWRKSGVTGANTGKRKRHNHIYAVTSREMIRLIEESGATVIKDREPAPAQQQQVAGRFFALACLSLPGLQKGCRLPTLQRRPSPMLASKRRRRGQTAAPMLPLLHQQITRRGPRSPRKGAMFRPVLGASRSRRRRQSRQGTWMWTIPTQRNDDRAGS